MNSGEPVHQSANESRFWRRQKTHGSSFGLITQVHVFLSFKSFSCTEGGGWVTGYRMQGGLASGWESFQISTAEPWRVLRAVQLRSINVKKNIYTSKTDQRLPGRSNILWGLWRTFYLVILACSKTDEPQSRHFSRIPRCRSSTVENHPPYKRGKYPHEQPACEQWNVSGS